MTRVAPCRRPRAGCDERHRRPTPAPLADDAITVGSFDFAESVVLAEVYSQALEAAGFDVERAFALGPREFVGPALAAGLVELVPEYAGTAAEFHSLGAAEPTDDVAATHDELVARRSPSAAVVALAAGAGAGRQHVRRHRRRRRERLGLETLSDLGAVAATLVVRRPAGVPAAAALPGRARRRVRRRRSASSSRSTPAARSPVSALQPGDVDVALHVHDRSDDRASSTWSSSSTTAGCSRRRTSRRSCAPRSSTVG